MQNKRIGLALSGGGIRAAIFHLGAMEYLAQAKLFDQINYLSTVSGASIAVGLIFAVNFNRWPTGEEFLYKIMPQVRKLILENNIQRSALMRLPFSPKYWRHRVKLLAKMLEDKWGIHGNLQDIPILPHWEINCTTFETGNNFRIRTDYMGDDAIGYVQNPKIPLSHVIAASAAFPVLIGPYILQTNNFMWTKDKHGRKEQVTTAPQYTLWDGGVYDNLGLDALYKTGRGLDKEVDFLIVSNASASIDYQRRHGHISLANLRRLLDISQNQVDILRTRQVISSIISKGLGLYFKIGYTAEHIAKILGIPEREVLAIVGDHLSEDQARKVRNYPTTLNSPCAENFDLIFRHGYENAKCVHLLLERRNS